MKMNKAMTKRQYIKRNTKIALMVALMLMLMTGCSKKQSEETVSDETPIVTEIPQQDQTSETEQEPDAEVEEDSEEKAEEDTNSTPEEDASDRLEEEQEEITVTPEVTPEVTVTPEEDFTEEDPVETITPDGEVLTQEQAVAAVAGMSKETLGLPNELGQYSIIVDGWTTMVKGKECYCLNVYDYVNDRQQLIKMFYVTMDGKEVFTHDDERGEFIRINK